MFEPLRFDCSLLSEKEGFGMSSKLSPKKTFCIKYLTLPSGEKRNYIYPQYAFAALAQRVQKVKRPRHEKEIFVHTKVIMLDSAYASDAFIT